MRFFYFLIISFCILQMPSTNAALAVTVPSNIATCSEINGTSDMEIGVSGLGSISSPVRLQQGDMITFTWQITETYGYADRLEFFWTSEVSPGDTILNVVPIAASGNITPVLTFTAPASAAYGFGYNFLDNPGMSSLDTTLLTSCISGGIQSHAQAAQAANLASNVLQAQTNNLITGRIRQISTTRVRGSQIPAQTPNANANQNQGKNAGAPDYDNGFWANMSLTYAREDHPAAAFSGIQGSAVVGLDTRLGDELLAGIAANLEYATLSRENNVMQFSSTGLGLSPYVSYQLDDVFSLSALGNITYTQNHSGFNTGTQIDQDAIRWHAEIQGDAFWVWGNWALLTGLGLGYGQTHLLETRDSNGLLVASRQTRLGSVDLTLQPSYYWEYGAELALEPYLLNQYTYDFSMTKISTQADQPRHPNDQDAFRLGVGLNIFGSNFYSGNIEASTILGRDHYNEANITGNVRIQF